MGGSKTKPEVETPNPIAASARSKQSAEPTVAESSATGEQKTKDTHESSDEKRVNGINHNINGAAKKNSLCNVVTADLPDEVLEICKNELQEDNHHLMKLFFHELGLKSFKELVDEAVKLTKSENENDDKVMTNDKKRKRTKGGIFITLVKDKIGAEKYSFLVKENIKERKKQKIIQKSN